MGTHERQSFRYVLFSWDSGENDDASQTGQAQTSTSMDPFSKRLRKQRERSSLHARQLNKNAMTMLRRQLNVLERHEMQNARALRRSRQALLEELEASRDIDHEVPEPKARKPASLPDLSPQRTTTLQSWLGEENTGLDLAGPVSANASLRGTDSHGAASARTAVSSGSNSSFKGVSRNSSARTGEGHQESGLFRRHLSGSSNGESAATTPHAQQTGSRSSTSCEQLSCRFSALSPLSPCRYFPCTRPQHYHHLKVSDVDVPGESIPFRAAIGRVELRGGGGGRGGGLPVLAFPSSSPSASSSFTSISDNHNSNCKCHSTAVDAWSSVASSSSSPASSPRCNAAVTSTSPGGNVEPGGTDSGSASPRGKSRFAEAGVWTSRTTIQQRVRGLKQVAHGMREKNAAKKPKDWAVNYGQPVSRRLLRKPVVAVSEVVL